MIDSGPAEHGWPHIGGTGWMAKAAKGATGRGLGQKRARENELLPCVECGYPAQDCDAVDEESPRTPHMLHVVA